MFRSTVVAGVVLVAVGVAGCGGSQHPGPTPAGSLSAAAAGSGPSTGSSAADGAPSDATVAVLPESALRPLSGGGRYARIPGAPDVSAGLQAKAATIAGYIGREIHYRGMLLGTVQLLRVRPGVVATPAQGEELTAAFLKDFARSTAVVPRSIGGRNTLVATGARGGNVGTVAWWQAGDITVVWGPEATRLASIYLTGRG